MKNFFELIRTDSFANRMWRDRIITARIIKACLADEELWRGGIFSKEKYYMKKYNLTEEQITKIEVATYNALNVLEAERHI